MGGRGVEEGAALTAACWRSSREGGAAAWAALVGAAAVSGALCVLGWAVEEKSCFRTEEGVGWGCVGAALLGDADIGAAGDAAGAPLVFGLVLALVLAGACSPSTEEEVGREVDEGMVPLPCLGELLLLPGLTGLTGKGPQVLAAGENVPPNCAMGRRGWRICCMVWAASRASWGWA